MDSASCARLVDATTDQRPFRYPARLNAANVFSASYMVAVASRSPWTNRSWLTQTWPGDAVGDPQFVQVAEQSPIAFDEVHQRFGLVPQRSLVPSDGRVIDSAGQIQRPGTESDIPAARLMAASPDARSSIRTAGPAGVTIPPTSARAVRHSRRNWYSTTADRFLLNSDGPSGTARGTQSGTHLQRDSGNWLSRPGDTLKRRIFPRGLSASTGSCTDPVSDPYFVSAGAVRIQEGLRRSAIWS